MGMHLEIHFEASILNVGATGKFSLLEAKRNFLEILEALVQYRAEKILIDGREVDGKPELIERFYYGEFAAKEASRLLTEHRMSCAPRFAYVLNEPLRHPRRFGETVAVNRGMLLKVCETTEEAFEWLELSRAATKNAPHARTARRPRSSSR
jgi:hypothetical protein